MSDPNPTGPSRTRWFSRTVLGFGVAGFLSDLGHEAATSALPLLLASLGAAPLAPGIIEGVSDGAASFAKLFGGWFAYRPERRKPIAVLVPRELRGSAFGLLASANGVGDMVSSAVVGIVWSATGPIPAFPGAAGICLVGTGLLAAGASTASSDGPPR